MTQTPSPTSSSPGKVQPIESADDGQEDSHATPSSLQGEPNDAKIPPVDTCAVAEVTTPQIVELSDDEPVPEESKSVSDVLVKDWMDSDDSVMEDSSVSEKPKELPMETYIDCTEESKENSPFIAKADDQTITVNKDDAEVSSTNTDQPTTVATDQSVEEAMVVEPMPLTLEPQ